MGIIFHSIIFKPIVNYNCFNTRIVICYSIHVMNNFWGLQFIIFHNLKFFFWLNNLIKSFNKYHFLIAFNLYSNSYFKVYQFTTLNFNFIYDYINFSEHYHLDLLITPNQIFRIVRFTNFLWFLINFTYFSTEMEKFINNQGLFIIKFII